MTLSSYESTGEELWSHSYSTLSTGHQKGDDVCPDAQAYLQTKLPTVASNPVKSFQMRKNVQKSFEIQVVI